MPGRFESALTAALGRPLGWLVVAEPTALLDAEVAELRAQVTVLRQHDEERFRFGTDRAERRLAELDAYREGGLWLVRVLVGAQTPGELARLAPVLAGSADLGHHPYRLGAGPEALSLAAALAARTGPAGTGAAGAGAGAGPAGAEAQVPFPATAGVLTALAGLPQREVPGLRVLGASQFDVTSETGTGEPEPGVPAGDGDGRAGDSRSGDGRSSDGRSGDGPGDDGTPVRLGVILDARDRPAGDFLLPLPTLNRHALVTGATGAGKSQTVRHLLAELTLAGLPWLAIEPVKAEYPGMAGRLAGLGPAGQVTVLNPADPGAIPLSVNPLAPERGYPVQAHIDMVRALFLAAFDADEPFPQIIAQALQRVYEANGWDLVTGGGLAGAVAEPAVPTLAQLQRAALEVIGEVGYGRELQADVRGFVDVRLRSLRIGSAGRFFEGGHPADVAALLRRNVVLCLEDVANDEDKAFLMGTLIIRIVEHLRLAARAGRPAGLRHVIVIEEAHRLLRAQREGRASGHAVELFAAMLAEIRAYGEGLVIAEQIPAKLVSDVVKNTALKVMHRLPAADDRDLVGAAMNLGEAQSRQVVSLAPGEAAVFADGMDRPIRIRVPFGGAAECPGPGPVPPMLARRSTACGPACTGERACTAAEMRAAEVLAAPGSPADAWLRVWAEVLLLAFLTNRALPAVPSPLRGRWGGLGGRLRECLLATVVDRAVAVRARALRPSYDPARLAASVARIAADASARPGREPGGNRAGISRAPAPAGSSPRCAGCTRRSRALPAPAGRPDPGRCARRRSTSACPACAGLAGRAGGAPAAGPCGAIRCPWTWPENRLAAWTALLGEDDQRGFGRRPGRPRRRAAPAAAAQPAPPRPDAALRPGCAECCPGPVHRRAATNQPGRLVQRVTARARKPG